MIKRRKTRIVKVGTFKMGYTKPILVQSMTKVPTTDVARCVRQVNKLIAAGCGLVRIAVPTKADTVAFAKIVQKVKTPLIADIHFSPARAIEAIEAGAAKIRLNPGNIKKRGDIFRIIDSAKAHGAAIRIGVNEASIRDLHKAAIPANKRVSLMLKEMKRYVRLFESRGFSSIVLSAKSPDTVRTIEINRLLSQNFSYPIHLGLTHAGLEEDAKISSAVAIGSLLSEGIGDTIRVSIAGDPVREIQVARDILRSLGLLTCDGPQLVVCPTCGRCQVDVVKLAKKIRPILKNVKKPLRLAVMGCIVNGPGEAADADLAVCAAKGKGFIYRNGKKKAVVEEGKLLERLTSELDSF